jgi:hypothetical protein
MPTLHVILLLIALILFLLAGFGAAHPRVNLVALGLAAVAGALLL